MRSLFLLVAGLPMLMPPGMCVCQFVPCRTAAVPLATTQLLASQGPRHAPDCTCCRSHRLEASADTSPRDYGPEATPGSPSPCPLPGKHWPGCPAALGVAPVQVALPTTAVLPDADLAGGRVQIVVEPAAPVLRVNASPVAPETPPLFLAHCTLLI